MNFYGIKIGNLMILRIAEAGLWDCGIDKSKFQNPKSKIQLLIVCPGSGSEESANCKGLKSPS